MKRKLIVIHPDRVTCHAIDPSLHEGRLPFVTPLVNNSTGARLVGASSIATMLAGEASVLTAATDTYAAAEEAELRALRSP